ncbi:hypothetical protein EI545_02175 [Tabrizicola piscis]|uniref:SCP domain-containing protein n=1 Tax=Tabrizicola piscis TaxID=2494374 RepID=A0A3S8U2C2_9RHOB|nr:CAP domain-containing protein [Tabrizicola piscis]AZL57754.1 hypothetical protein EI545_02175 [Tabrizicola piscis]
MSVANEYEVQMLALINAERAAYGLAALKLNAKLNTSAETHSRWMLQADVFSHTGSGGSSAGERMGDAGYVFSGNWTLGENISWQSQRGAAGISDDVINLHNSLMNSPGHRANILNPNFVEIGIGIEVGQFATNGSNWPAVMVTQNFARSSADNGGPGTIVPDVPVTEASDVVTGTARADVIDALGGHDSVNGLGGNDSLRGGSGNDTLNGGADNDQLIGGLGDDQLTGGTGNDYIDGGDGSDRAYFTGTVAANVNLGLTTAQSTGHGTDTILNVEHISSGSGNDRLTGNSLGNSMNSGAGNDTLSGAAGNDSLNGGTGSDTLIGGGGADSFIFNTTLGSSNVDRITDFNVVADTIQLEDAIFSGLSAGTLAASAFVRNTSGNAADTSDRIIYESDTGRLYFDRDGTGAAAKVHFATLDTGLALTNADFFVF